MEARPRIADLFCGAGGAGMGLHCAGFEVVGFDIEPQPRYPFEFHQADALTVDLSGFDAVWASPPCQGYSIMNNLPWLRGRDYPLLILPTRQMLDALGKPYIIENVMGARHGAKGLKKRGLESHGMQAGWLCGGMFELRFYRHRLFETNWFWMQPGHPRHQVTIRASRTMAGRARDFVFPSSFNNPKPRGSWEERFQDTHPGASPQAEPKGNFDRWRASGSSQAALMGKMATLGKWQNGAQVNGVGIGHAKGWRLAAEAMDIDWMKRGELTQAIPPAYSEYLGQQLIKALQP